MIVLCLSGTEVSVSQDVELWCFDRLELKTACDELS